MHVYLYQNSTIYTIPILWSRRIVVGEAKKLSPGSKRPDSNPSLPLFYTLSFLNPSVVSHKTTKHSLSQWEIFLPFEFQSWQMKADVTKLSYAKVSVTFIQKRIYEENILVVSTSSSFTHIHSRLTHILLHYTHSHHTYTHITHTTHTCTHILLHYTHTHTHIHPENKRLKMWTLLCADPRFTRLR